MNNPQTFTREQVLEAIALRPCHVTGQHDPDHTPDRVCESQLSQAFTGLLDLLGVTPEDLPHALHESCHWCHDVPVQEIFRVKLRRVHAWAGVPVPAELAAPAPDARP